MGFYINTPNESKEAFLSRKGLLLQEPPKWEDIPNDCLPVVLVENTTFTAAGIAYCPAELKVFTNPYDPRIKRYYAVKIVELFDVSDLPRNYKKQVQ